jgi:hypothetical protein
MSDLASLMEKVNPANCPFCGEGKFVRLQRYQFPPDDEGPAWKWGYHVICDASGIGGRPRGCGSSSAWGETTEEALSAWDRRAPLTALAVPVGYVDRLTNPTRISPSEVPGLEMPVYAFPHDREGGE